MFKSISNVALLALTAVYSVNLQAQPGPRGPQFPQRGPDSNGHETRRPVSHGQHGPSRGDAHHRHDDGDRNHGRPPQSRPPQARPSHGPQQRGPQQRGPQYHGPQQRGPQHDRPQSRPGHDQHHRAPQGRPTRDSHPSKYQARPSHGHQYRGPQQRGPQHGRPQSRPNQSRPNHGPAVHGPQDRGAQQRPQQHPQKHSQFDRHQGSHSNAPRGPQTGPGQRPPQGKPQARPSYSRPSYDSRTSRPSTPARPSTMAMRIPPEVQEQLGRIKAAVEAGKLTREQAMKKIMELRQQRMGSPASKTMERTHSSHPSKSAKPSDAKPQTSGQEYLRQYVSKLYKAVAAGELSKAEAAEKIAAVRKKLEARKSQNAPQSKPAYPAKPQTQQRPQARPTDRAPQTRPHTRPQTKSGTQSQAKPASPYRPQGQPQDRPQDPRGNAGSQRGPRPAASLSPAVRAEAGRLMMELRKAVESGKITREQAMERFNQWRQRFGTQAPQSGRPPMARPQSQRRPDVAPLPAQAIKPAKQVPAQATKAAEGTLKKESIPATKIQPSKVFQLPPEKK